LKFRPSETTAADAEFEAELQEEELFGESGISSSKINYKFSFQQFL